MVYFIYFVGRMLTLTSTKLVQSTPVAANAHAEHKSAAYSTFSALVSR